MLGNKIVHRASASSSFERVRAAAHRRIQLAAAPAADNRSNIPDDIACLMPLATAFLPQTARSVTFSPLTGAEDRHDRGVLVAQEVAELCEVVGIGSLPDGCDDRGSPTFFSLRTSIVHIAREDLVLHLLNRLVQLA